MRFVKELTVLAVSVMLLVLSACSAPVTDTLPSADPAAAETAEATPVPTETPAETPSPTPQASPAPDPDAILQAMRTVDILDFIPADTYARTEGQRWYEPVIKDEELTLSLPGKYIQWVETAMDEAYPFGVSSVALEIDTPSWPLLAAIAANYEGDPENMREALFQAGGLACRVEPTASGGYTATIVVNPPNPTDLMYSLPETETTNAFSLLVSYAYLATVFDDNLQGREGIGTPDLEELLFPIARPERYYFVDCWALPRDGGARLHTGTDINAPEGTDLYAVVDGTILYNGTNRTAGNYIVMQGHDGTQYHYYHLVEPSDVAVGTPVKTGDVIAHVGNTGNSTANHLHFTIVTNMGQYVNPYTYLREAQERTVAANAMQQAPESE